MRSRKLCTNLELTKLNIELQAMAITQYGVDDLGATLNHFKECCDKILYGNTDEEALSLNKKTLRKFKMKEACEMTGRSDAFLRKLENTDTKYEPEKINGIRYYTLDLINLIRDKAGTRYTRPQGSNPIVFAVSNFKGGVGKTTTTNSLASKLALSGLKVLCVGMEGQATDALYYGFIPDLQVTSEETIKTALLEDPKNIRKLIKKTFFAGIDIIPGNLSLSQVEICLTDYKEQMEQSKRLGFPDERLDRALEFIKNDYDVILLDCGPNLNILTLNAFTACNALLIPLPPASPDVASLRTYCTTLGQHLASTGKIKSLDFCRVLISKHPKNKSADTISRQILEEFGLSVMQKYIVHSAEIERAATEFCSLYELIPTSKKTYQRAMDSMESVFNEILDAFKQIWDAQANEGQDNGSE